MVIGGEGSRVEKEGRGIREYESTRMKTVMAKMKRVMKSND